MEEIDEKQPPSVLTSDTDNNTVIPAEEAPPGKREKFRRFRAYNTGMWNGPRRENKEAKHRQDNLHRYDAIASQAGLTKYQRERGRNLLDDIPVKETGLSLDKIAFALCVIVANLDHPEKRYWPHADAVNDDDDELASLGSSLGLSPREEISSLMTIKRRLGL